MVCRKYGFDREIGLLEGRINMSIRYKQAGLFFLTVSLLSIYSFPFEVLRAQTAEKKIIAIERSALDRWKTGDVYGFVDAAADQITYFDPGLEKRCDGIGQLRAYLAPANGTFSFPSYELIDPRVQLFGETAVLTYNFVGHLKSGAKDRWNTTEVYHRFNGKWKLVSSHWSHTKPKP